MKWFKKIRNLSKNKLISWGIPLGIATIIGLLTYPFVGGKTTVAGTLLGLGLYGVGNIIWEVIKRKKEAIQ